MLKSKKVLGAILTITMLCLCFSSLTFAAKAGIDSGDKADGASESQRIYAKKIPSFNITGNGKIISINNVGLSSWWEDKSYDGVDGKYITEGVSTSPENDERGDIEFDFVPDSTDTYCVWAYTYPTSVSKSTWISMNEKYNSALLASGAAKTWQWTLLGTYSAKSGETVHVKMIPKLSSYGMAYIGVVKGKNFMPSGTKGKIEEIKKNYAKKIPSFNITGNGKVVSIDDVGLSSWWVNKSYDGVEGKYITEGVSASPKNDERGDIEFDFVPDLTDTYCVWAYTYPTSVSKTTWISINGEYSTSALSSGLAKTWQWALLGTYSAKSGETVHVKMIPRMSSYGMAYIGVVKGKNFMPSGTKGDVVEKAFDTSVIYPTPTLTPSKGVHPRVMFTAEDIAQIKENMSYEGNAEALKRYEINLNSDTDGTLPAPANGLKTNFNGEILNIIQCRAFEYAINGNEEMGKSAVLSMRNYINSVAFDYADDQSYNRFGELEYVIGCVYDWCHNLLADTDKELFRDAVIEYATNKIGYPPSKLGSVTGHGTEGPLLRDLLAPAIAMYDEYPSIYENVAGRIYSEYVPAKNFLYYAHMGVMQGGYTNYREKWSAYTLWLMGAIGEKNIFGANQQYTPYWFLYARRPDGATLIDGDCNPGNNDYYHSYYNYSDLAMLIANYYDDPYLKWEYLRQQKSTVPVFSTNQSVNCTTMFICNKKMEAKSVEELPLSYYFAEPKGAYIARTGWSDGYNSPDVVCEFKVNEYWTSNHQHLDAGAFQIYYKGYLATDSGYYAAVKTSEAGSSQYGSNHWKNYYTRTIAHNCMLVNDPNETFPSGYEVNDGGQQLKNDRKECGNLDTLLSESADMKVGEVLGHEMGLDTYAPNYTYLKGDITNAYSDKVSEYQRSFMFLNLKNKQHPAALVILDHVVSSDASFKKSFAVNTVAEPQIDGTRLVVNDTRKFDAANHYNGKMTIDTLMPAADNVSYAKYVGDDKYSYSGDLKTFAFAPQKSDGSGTRTEISPKTAEKEDYFLNVIQVGDADGAEALDTTLIETPTHAGAVVADRVVMMGKAKNRVADKVSFTVNNEGSFEFTVTDLKAGTWNVNCDGTQLSQAKVTEDGGVATFIGTNGSYTMTYASGDSDKQFTQTVNYVSDPIGIRINGRFFYSDVAPFIENDRTLVPLRTIFEGIGAEVTYDESTATATGIKGDTTVQITEDNTTAYVNGVAVELDVPAKTYSDRFMVPIRFIADSFGCEVNWRNEAQIVDITADVALVKQLRDKKYDNEITIIDVEASGDDGENYIENTLDGSLGTRWSVAGKDGESAWAVYDLGQVYNLDKIYMAFHSGNARQTTFGIDVSSDGIQYTNVIKATSSGNTVNLEDFDLNGAVGRYVKFRGYGNSVNEWNSVTEFIVTEKK